MSNLTGIFLCLPPTLITTMLGLDTRAESEGLHVCQAWADSRCPLTLCVS